MNRHAHWLASPSVCADNPPSRHQLLVPVPVRHGGGGLRLFLSVTLKIGKKDLLIFSDSCVALFHDMFMSAGSRYVPTEPSRALVQGGS